MPDRPCFEIGLTMAGAISAGAYTAGVIDFLFEALDAIEDVRAGRDTSYLNAGKPGSNPVFNPPHDVRIKTMSGTSAGSMVTAIVATILGTRIRPVGPNRNWTDTGATGNPLYDAWVQDIHYDKLLEIGDVVDGKHVSSLLDSDALGDIVKRTLSFAQQRDYRRPYVADAVPIYFCISNLRGVRYSFQLDVSKGIADEYQMSMHADWMSFNWSDDAAQRAPFVPISPGKTAPQWDILGKAALASGAFPLGLAPRELDRPFADYVQRKWFVPGALMPPRRKKDEKNNDVEPPDSPDSWESRAGRYETISPLDKPADFPDGYEFLNVDGGIFDNEPLELARRALAGDSERNPRDGRIARRGLILIDPFPNLFKLNKAYKADDQRDLLTVVKNLFPAMIAQARFKLDELELAKDPNVASRYAIMPVRYDDADHVADHAIACGSLGGFGGFLSKAFRHHDFMLGRRNCQRFLAKHFMLPSDSHKGIENKLFAGWTDPKIRAAFQDKGAIEVDKAEHEVQYLPIIPLLGKLGDPEYTRMPPWPSDPSDLDRAALKSAITKRMDAVKDSLVAQYKPAWGLKLGMAACWRLKKDEWVDRFAIEKVAAALKDYDIRF